MERAAERPRTDSSVVNGIVPRKMPLAIGAGVAVAVAAALGFLAQHLLGANDGLSLLGRIGVGAAVAAPLTLVGGALGVASYQDDPKETSRESNVSRDSGGLKTENLMSLGFKTGSALNRRNPI